MKNKIFKIGLIVLLLIFAVTIVGCKTKANGTWVSDHGGEMRMNKGNYEFFNYADNEISERGTYTINGNRIEFTPTSPARSKYTANFIPKENKYIIVNNYGITYIKK